MIARLSVSAALVPFSCADAFASGLSCRTAFPPPTRYRPGGKFALPGLEASVLSSFVGEPPVAADGTAAPLASSHLLASMTSSGRTSSMTALAGRRFCANPIRPSFKSARICSCWVRSKPCCSSNPTRLESLADSAFPRGSSASKSVWTIPRNSARARQAAPNLSNSARRGGESARNSCRSNAGTVSA